MIEAWECVTAGATSTCTVTASSTITIPDTVASSVAQAIALQLDLANFTEWLVLGGLILFFLSLISWSVIFSPIAKAYDR